MNSWCVRVLDGPSTSRSSRENTVEKINGIIKRPEESVTTTKSLFEEELVKADLQVPKQVKWEDGNRAIKGTTPGRETDARAHR